MGIYMIRVHHRGEMRMLKNVNSRGYKLADLFADVVRDGIDKVTASQEGLSLRMKFDVSDSMDQVEIVSEESVVQMFERNQRYMEVELYVDTEIALPLTIVDGNKVDADDFGGVQFDGTQGESSKKETEGMAEHSEHGKKRAEPSMDERIPPGKKEARPASSDSSTESSGEPFHTPIEKGIKIYFRKDGSYTSNKAAARASWREKRSRKR